MRKLQFLISLVILQVRNIFDRVNMVLVAVVNCISPGVWNVNWVSSRLTV